MVKTQLHATRAGIFAIITLSVIYGLTAVFARYLGKSTGLYEQWYLRYGLACVFLTVLFHKKIHLHKFQHLKRKEWFLIIFRSCLGCVVAVALYTLASEKTKIGVVSFMQVIPTTTLLGVFILHEKISRNRIILTLLSFLGAAIVVVNGFNSFREINVGAFYSLLSGILFGLFFVTRTWHSNVLNNIELTVVTTGVGFFVNYALSVIVYHRIFVRSTTWNKDYIIVLLLAAAVSVATNFLLNYGFEHVSAVIAGTLLSLEQVFGVLFGFLFYGELLTSREITGGLIILISVALTNLVNSREQISEQSVLAAGA